MTNAHDMFTADGALEAFKATFDPTDESGGLPMLLVRDEEDQLTVMALATDTPMQQTLFMILSRMPKPKALTLTAESWVLDPETRERTGEECVMISGADESGCWARLVNFERDVEANTVEWGEPTDISGDSLRGGVPHILRQAVR